jgi:hypothetical protein
MGGGNSKAQIEGEILMQGFLLKQSDHLGQWRKRYAVLATDRRSKIPVLSFYHDSPQALYGHPAFNQDTLRSAESSVKLQSVLAGAQVGQTTRTGSHYGFKIHPGSAGLVRAGYPNRCQPAVLASRVRHPPLAWTKCPQHARGSSRVRKG